MFQQALESALKLLRVFEGCRLKAYQDIVGVWTICFGSTSGITAGMVKTQTQCDLLLSSEAGVFMLRVLAACPQLLNEPCKLAAVTSFAYNLGLPAFRGSTLRKKCQHKNWNGAFGEFKKWNKAGGIVRRGLVIRRSVEANMFINGKIK